MKNKSKLDVIAEEAQYFDEYVKRGERPIDKSWLARLSWMLYPAGLDNKELLWDALGDVEEKNVLELGCGVGELTYKLAEKGACVSAIDISPMAVEKAKEKCRVFAERVSVRIMDANNLEYGTEQFDLVVGNSILHHLNCVRVAGEIQRVLKNNGKAVFIEPLAHNPILNVWRWLTPHIRTSNERPLTYSDIKRMGNNFRTMRYQEYELLQLLSSIVYLITFSQKAKKKSGEWLRKYDTPFLRKCKLLRRFSSEILIEFGN